MKILAKKLFFALAIAGALSACSDDDDGGSPAPTQSGQPVVSSPTQSTDTGETTVLPEAAEEPSVAQVESQLPPISALDTFGGQLLAGYLDKTITDVEVIAQIFDEDDQVMSNLAEMSMAINQLKDEGRYTEQNAEDVRILEGAMTQFLNDRIAAHKKLEDYIEYGTAVGLGVIGGVYSNEVIAGVKKLGQSSLIQAPKNAIINVYHAAGGKAQQIGAWLSRQGDDVRNTTPVSKTVDASRNLYTRTVAYIATRGNATPKQLVQRHITRLFGSDELAKGFRVTEVPADDLRSVKRMVFYKTGITGLRLHQRKGENYFIAKQLDRKGEWNYFYVQGTGVRAITKNGEELLIPAPTMTAVAAQRMRDYGSRSVNFVSETGRKIKTGVTNSRAYQYISTNPRARRVVEGTAVGAAIGGITLLALRPIDTRYITLDDYVKDLEKEGVHLEEFLDLRRADAQAAAQIREVQQPTQNVVK